MLQQASLLICILAHLHDTHMQLLETTGAQQAEADAIGTAASTLITSPLFDHQKQVSSNTTVHVL
jgi:hypothetical protein